MNTRSGRLSPLGGASIAFVSLCLLTLSTWGIAVAGMRGLGASLLVLGIALLKGHLIGDWFMGLRGLSGLWRWAILLWLLIVGGLVTAAFVMASGG